MAELDRLFPARGFLSAAEAAQYLGMSVRRLRECCASGAIPTLAVPGKKHLISKRAIARLVVDSEQVSAAS